MKFVLTGATRSGKSSVVKLLDPKAMIVEETMASGEKTTVAMDIGKVILKDFQISLFATPGLQRFEAMRQILYRGTDVMIFLFDGESPKNDPNAMAILKEIHDVNAKKPPTFGIIFAINKCELTPHRTETELNTLIKKYLPAEMMQILETITIMKDNNNIKIFEISAKTNLNVQLLMQEALNMAFKKWKKTLTVMNQYAKSTPSIATALNITPERLKEIINEAEMRKLITIDRKIGALSLTDLGKKIL